MTARLVVKLGGVLVEAPLEPEALRALGWVFEALGLRLEEKNGTVILAKLVEGGEAGREATGS